jgi:hypothetical protein
MSCFNNCYLPQPPRAWSRVQNSCSLNTDSTSLLPLGQKMEMLNKGNVLQYKANSSNLTKAQKYSKIAKGQWVNRNTTWATQSSRGYTNPNTDGLKRAGNVVNIAIDPITGAILGPTTAPITCPQTNTIINEGLPSSQNDSINNPEVPPPVPPTPASEGFPEIIPESVVEPIVIPDGGTLICSVQENPCTGETKSSISQQQCNPTTDSDVPGPIQLLCWNDGTPTWYPRQRYVMTNSANKWPDNATLFSAVKPSAPIITFVSSIDNIVTLVWIQSEFCLPVSRFDIYQNDIFIKSVPGSTFTTNIEVVNCNTYEYFIIAVTNGSTIFSDPSNVVTITVIYTDPPQITGCLNTVSSSDASILLNLIPPSKYCSSIFEYIIYYSVNGIESNITIPVSSSYILNSLLINKIYTIYVKTVTSSGEISDPSNIISISTTYQPFSTVNSSSINYDSTNKIWSIIFQSTGSVTFTQDINATIYTTIVGGGGGGAYSSSASGAEAGYQAVNLFNNVTGGDLCIIQQVGVGGAGTATNGQPGIIGTNTIFNFLGGTYTVTGGFPGQTSGGRVSGASYSGPVGTNTYTGSGGDGGFHIGTCPPPDGTRGGDSYLYINSTQLQSLTGINILQYIFDTYGYYIGGGGGSGGNVGGEGGSQNNNGRGGAGSCSTNLSTQDGKGFGSGGGGYIGFSINKTSSGNGKNGLFIMFFNYPTC